MCGRCFVLPLLGWLWNIRANGLTGMLLAGSLVATLSFVWPPAVKPIFVGLMLVAAPIGMVVGELAMLLTMTDSKDKNDFEKAGDDQPQTLVQEFIQFIFENKKWWLIPILLSFALIGVLVVLSSTEAAPFIYTLF